jgi:hypothetical protein
MLRIERLNYVIGGVIVIAAALTQPSRIALGVAVGIALTCANFFVLRKLVTRWTADAAANRPSNASMLMLPKMLALMAAVVLSIMFLPIDPIAFTAGYSIFILSIIIDSIYSAMRPPSDAPADPTNPTQPGGT